MTIVEPGKSLGLIKRKHSSATGTAFTTHYSDTGDQQPDHLESWHAHPDMHFCLFMQGGNTELRKDKKVSVTPGHLAFYHAFEPHANCNAAFPSHNLILEINTAFLKNNSVSELDFFNAFHRNPDEVKLEMLKICKELSISDAASANAVEMLIMGMLHRDTVKKMPAWLERAKQVLNDRWSETVSLAELSAVCNAHPVTISKYFPKYFSVTLGQYQRRLKVARSVALVKRKALPLGEIAFECGFADQNHFIRVFKSETGFLPNELRRF
ncbi:MAG TPA: AraC family transcriptional regulator [Chitinophagaceae bacterium]|nr:AraC family transcriptional regulator [Chitinophagaceae bacterium]